MEGLCKQGGGMSFSGRKESYEVIMGGRKYGQVYHLYQKCKDKHCIQCKKFIGSDELYNVVITQTKRENLIIIHKSCLGGPNDNTTY